MAFNAVLSETSIDYSINYISVLSFLSVILELARHMEETRQKMVTDCLNVQHLNFKENKERATIDNSMKLF